MLGAPSGLGLIGSPIKIVNAKCTGSVGLILRNERSSMLYATRELSLHHNIK